MNSNQQILTRRLLYFVVIAVLFFIFCLTFKSLMLHGAKEVSLPAGSQLSSAISQSLTAQSANGYLPQEKTDYQIVSARYFSDYDWAVVNIDSVHDQFNPSWLVLHKVNGSYVVVLGPGSAFPSSISGLPAPVMDYLKQQGLLYEPAA